MTHSTASQAESGESRMPARKSPRVLWITNRAAPYRRPIWDALGRVFELQVGLLENDRRFLRDMGNRGAEWASGGADSYSTREIPTIRFVRGESSYYLSLATPLTLRFRPTAVLIGGWESPAYWQALLQAKLSRARTVGFYESTLQSQGFRRGPIARARSSFFRHLDMVVVPGIAARDALLGMGVKLDSIAVGFNAVDVESINRIAIETRRDLQLGGNKASPPVQGHRFLFAGQFIPRKRPVELIRAFSAVRADGDSLTMVGKGMLAQAVCEEIERLKLSDAVRVIPMVPYEDMPALLAGHDTLVLPSSEEVWGLVANEALAAGLHVVVTRVCGVTPSIENMCGVMIAEDKADLVAQMSLSRARWHGAIIEPEILKFTPKAFALVFEQALLGPAERMLSQGADA